jgi:ABC-type iron transport system FetAB permease component
MIMTTQNQYLYAKPRRLLLPTRVQAPPSAFAISISRSLSLSPRDAVLPTVGTTAARLTNSHHKHKMPTMLAAWPTPIKSWPTIQADVPTPSSLNPAQLISSMSTIILTASLLRMLNLNAQSSRILISATRMSVQLVVMGLFVLTPLFAFASTSPWRIASWITVVAILASREAKSRSKYTYNGQMRDCFLAIFGGVGLTLAHLVAFVLHPPFSNTKMTMNAQTIIPIAGMLFGSALSATTLGMSILLGNFLESGRERVELRLSRGANVWEAALPAVRESVEAALMPTVNAMAAAVSTSVQEFMMPA